MRLALFEPDIAPNTGAMLRLGACLAVGIDIIEPCGFPFSDRALRRAAMDYARQVELAHHVSWEAFLAERSPGRLILLSTRAQSVYTGFLFRPDDTLLVGRETAGVPGRVAEAADAALRIPMAPGARSLNVALAAAMVLGEALRQTRPDWTSQTGANPPA